MTAGESTAGIHQGGETGVRFTRLRLNGFKSFVDPTDLVIADGLTGVVGPNGCGKSNLLEALRWVMGETRPTAMRGEGMEDVIFAGSGSRGARHFAEVALSVDNSERRAPAGFNDTDTLEITRRITREGGSAYRVNGREVRARDVQMLFADASTGAHSPALVRQGQISELISARPKARRRILEEAAGISGLYARRHEAELRLNATETNLARIEDVTEGLAGQIATLERQARQAARYREIGAALRRTEGLLLWRRWRTAEDARAAAAHAQDEALRTAGRAELAARDAARAREEAETALPPLREEEMVAAAIVQRLEVERATIDAEDAQARKTIESLTARIQQLVRDAEREAALTRDAGDTVARLDAEAERLARALEGQDDRQAAAAAACDEAEAALAEAEAELAARTEALALRAAERQAAERRLDETRAARARAEAAAARSAADAVAAEATREAAAERLAETTEAYSEAAGLAQEAATAVSEAEVARAAAQGAEAEARMRRTGCESTVRTLSAEAEALNRLMQRDGAAADGLIDRVSVAPGFEQALAAALGDDLAAPLRQADGSGWAVLDSPFTPAPLPAGLTPLAERVAGPAALDRRLSQVGIAPDATTADALQPALRPGQRIVTAAGDLWRWDGFALRAQDGASATARTLERRNRLAALRDELAVATAERDTAASAHEAARDRLAAFSDAEQRARDLRRATETRAADAQRAMAQAEAALAQATARCETAADAGERHRAEAAEASEALGMAEAALDDLPDPGDQRLAVETARAAVAEARSAAMARRSAHEDLRREGQGRSRRLAEMAREREAWANRLATADARQDDLARRRAHAEDDLAEAAARPAALAQRRDALADGLSGAQSRRTAAADALAAAESVLRRATETERTAERAAGEAREGRARAEARTDAAATAAAEAETRIREAVDLSPEALRDRLGATEDGTADAEALEADAARLRRARDALGAVNLRAEEDMAEVRGEHDRLVAERADLQAAVLKLRAGIASLNREGRERLLTAFEQVNANFAMLFTHLFGGGEAKLVMVESDDPLEAGLEILCQPPGKKLSTLSLLSGGEQTLTALALIFGVFLANPAPICVLDEVDAPLDDSNVARFCDLLDEMTRRTETRFLIISHNPVTMARMDRLFGVTMAEQGVSQLVSVDLRRAEALVA